MFRLKKVFILILALFYLSVASGVMVNLHYFMGELASVEYGHSDEKGDCAKCGMPDNNNACCHTESALIKLQDDHQLSSLHFFFKLPEAEHSFVTAYTAQLNEGESSIDYIHNHAPPDDDSHAIYLHNCVFRI